MSRTTIDFGIDLGTTNSAIAMLKGTGTVILKNKDQHDITPSAVFIDKRRILVGERAKNQLEDKDYCSDVHIEFKGLMGEDHYYLFKTTGQRKLPEELSAEVLKELRTNAQTRLGTDISAAVITVPAAFELKQCAATRRAGELAGLSLCPLLLEPVAAALAYGFQTDVTKEYWLVYDFGGGTFDAAVIKAEEGTISVVNHRGDNHLGGSDIDWDMVEKLIVPKIVGNYNLPDFSRGNARWKAEFFKMKHAAERAKIELSGKETSVIECRSFPDASGKNVDIYQDIRRDDVIRVAERHIEKSLEICRRTLKEKGLAPSAIAKVILVGGPTLAPYFRQMLKDGLGIPLDVSCDPLTVVAQGAAIFAGTQQLTGAAAPKAAPGEFKVDLTYKPIGPDEDPIVRGLVVSPSRGSLDGYTVELVNTKTFWRSGKIRLSAEGRFKLQLLAEKGSRNEFAIELLSSTGSKQPTSPDHLVYTMGVAVSDMPVINPFAVALADNGAPCYIERGVPLPARVTRVQRTTVAVRRGDTGDFLRIPVVEGENSKADRNKLMGCLEIHGDKMKRDLPAGSEVEVTLIMDASRILMVKAYIPLLDEEFETRIDFEGHTPDAAHLHKQFDGELKRIDELKQKASMAEDTSGLRLLASIEDGDKMEEIRGLLSAARGDKRAAKKAENMLLKLQIELDTIEDMLTWPALVTEAQNELDQLDDVVARFGKKERASQAKGLRQEVEEQIEQRRPDRLSKKIEQVTSMRFAILWKEPSFLVGLFESLVADRDTMRDKSTADQLINQGRQCIEKENLDGLGQVDRQLIGLLPREIAKSRGYDSTVQE